MTYEFMHQYWWFLVSLLGALLVFLMFVQGANSLIFTLGSDEVERKMVINSTGRKWEFTFTTLVTFGGAFFASFPLFYSTSFGGAYWLWMIILFSFVVQAVSYEFQNKLGNIFGPRLFQIFLVINGIVGPVLIGVAVATFFNGSEFIVDKARLTDLSGDVRPIISRWANGSHGLDAIYKDFWNLCLGLAVFFLARVLGILYIINNVADTPLRSKSRSRLVWESAVFLAFFLAFLVHVLIKDGFAYDPVTGVIATEPMKYLHNLLQMWYVLLLLLAGVALVLYALWRSVREESYVSGIWPGGVGTVLVVLSLLLCAGWNHTAYYPSNVDLQDSLTIANSCSSEFTLTTMTYVSLIIPFVLAYIVYAWRAIDSKKIDREEMKSNDHVY